MVIALDGPAGSGKSSIAKRIAKELGGIFINSGAMYRHITKVALQQKTIQDPRSFEEIAQRTKWGIEDGSLTINSYKIGQDLHTDQIDQHVSKVSSHPALRTLINTAIRELANNAIVIVEGRDMTTVAFPDAPHKFYIDASSTARAHRRFLQGTSGLSEEEIKTLIEERDEADKKKTVGALKYDKGTTYIDTSDLTMDEVCAKMMESIQGQ